jgi:hypothetical protein
MKTPLCILVAFILISINAISQPGSKLVPQVVKDQYLKDFPGIVPARWEVKAGKQFEAVLTHNNMHCRARYFASGEKHFTAYHYPAANVPQNVSSIILQEYKGFKVDWATRLINHKKNTDRYWVRLTKPRFVLKALVNADGTFAHADDEDMEIKE